MIESTIEKDNNEISYPCLMESHSGRIVLFMAASAGILLKQGANTDPDRGYYSKTWNMDNYEPFNGTITLKNK